MIVLSKKRILTIIGIVFVGIITFFMQINLENDSVVPTMALPVSNKVIVIDARTRKAR